MNSFDLIRESATILCESTQPSIKEISDIRLILEDANSPVTNKYIEKLYEAVLSKGHIDFDTIPASKGLIQNYTGYATMNETLDNIMKLAQEHNSHAIIKYVNVVKQSIRGIERLSDIYEKGFKLRNDYIIIEYNTYVYTCVQATTSLLSEFVDYIKRPDVEMIQVTLKNNKQRADIFYIEQLEKFNNVVVKMEYRNYLQTLLSNSRENFIGTETFVGMSAVTLVALAIVPVTRELIYQFYHMKAKLSDALAQQAYFLEMNKANVMSNTSFNAQKKKDVLAKQDLLRRKLLQLSDRFKVTHAMSMDKSKRLIQNENSLLSIDRLERETSGSKLSLL